MGKAYVDRKIVPYIAKLTVPDLKLCIFGGDAGHPSARTNLRRLPSGTTLLFASADWEDLARDILGENLIGFPRYVFTSEKLNIARLRHLSSHITSPFYVQKIDLRLARRLSTEQSAFSADHVRHFGSSERFLHLGFGFCALDGSKIVSVATTFAVCKRGVEMQINNTVLREAQYRAPYQLPGIGSGSSL
jgi:hypothetical protein